MSAKNVCENITKYITFSDGCIINMEYCYKTNKVGIFDYYIHPFRYLDLVKFCYGSAFVWQVEGIPYNGEKYAFVFQPYSFIGGEFEETLLYKQMLYTENLLS